MAAHQHAHADVYRYVPPEQVVARAVTYIEDVLLEFTLTLSGSLLVTCADPPGTSTQKRVDLRTTGAALDRIADGLFVSAVRGDEPRIESASGYRFIHVASSYPGRRSRRFAGRCVVEIPGRSDAGRPSVSGSLDYTLDVSGTAPSDPPAGNVHSIESAADGRWSERYERLLASIGAVVLAPVPVAADRAAHLYAV